MRKHCAHYFHICCTCKAQQSHTIFTSVSCRLSDPIYFGRLTCRELRKETSRQRESLLQRYWGSPPMRILWTKHLISCESHSTSMSSIICLNVIYCLLFTINFPAIGPSPPLVGTLHSFYIFPALHRLYLHLLEWLLVFLCFMIQISGPLF